MKPTSFRLKLVPPFRLDLTVWALRRRANNIVEILERMLGTRQDLFELYRLASEDAQLSQLAQRYRWLKPPRFPTLFEAVINGIACQQITLTLGIILLGSIFRAVF